MYNNLLLRLPSVMGIREYFGLEGTLKAHPVHPPAMNVDIVN